MNEFIGIYIVFSFFTHLFFVVINKELLTYYPKIFFLEKILCWYIFLTPITFLLTIPLIIFGAISGIIIGGIWIIRYLINETLQYWKNSKDVLL